MIVEPVASAAMTGEALDFETVHAVHGAFVWRVLRRMGVRQPDVPDMAQEAFVVVHRKLGSYDGRRPVKGWLFAICVRVAADYRKRAHVRREVPTEEVPDAGADPAQHAELERRRARELLERILESLDDDKRAVFVLFELEQMSMADVAQTVGVPLQTAYSRLHAGRQLVQAAITRYRKGELR